MDLLSALKHTAPITPASVGSQTVLSGTVAFKTLRCVIEVAYIFASVNSITVKFIVWKNTTRKELHPFELTSKITTAFAYNDTSRGLHKKTLLLNRHYKRIEMHIKDAIETKQNVM